MLFGKRQQKRRDDIHEYWRHPDKTNDPEGYFDAPERSEFLVSLVTQYVKPDASILELGCNVGRNLNYLWRAGYCNLSGVEINQKALAEMKAHYTDMRPTIHEGTIEKWIKELGNYDLIFTMAVLEHLHTDSESVFEEIVKRAKVLITIEDEKNVSERHFPRNYRKIFEGLGMKQVYEKHLSQTEGLNKKFYARVFTKQ